MFRVAPGVRKLKEHKGFYIQWNPLKQMLQQFFIRQCWEERDGGGKERREGEGEEGGGGRPRAGKLCLFDILSLLFFA